MTPVNVVSFTHLLLGNMEYLGRYEGKAQSFLLDLENSGSFRVLKKNQTKIPGIVGETFFKKCITKLDI